MFLIPKVRRRLSRASRLQGSGNGRDKSSHARREREIRRGFQGVGKARLMSDQEERFGPLWTVARIEVGPDDAVLSVPAFDGLGLINRAFLGDTVDNGFRERREAVRIQLIEVESVRFPIFVEAKAKIEAWLAPQPSNVRQGFLGLGRAILAVEIEAFAILPVVQNKAHRVQARAKPNIPTRRPGIFLEKATCSQRPGRLIAVDAGRDIDAWGLHPPRFTLRNGATQHGCC